MFFMIGCSSPFVPTIEPTHISLPTQTSTATVIRPIPTNTASPTTTFTLPPTWTPLPTFSPSEGTKILHTWLQGTDDCLLPCWAEITPGQTSWEGARQLLEPMSGFSTVNITEDTVCGFGKCNGIGWSLFPQTSADGGFYSKLPENTIHLMIINIQDAGLQKTNLLETANLEMILSLYGVPSMLLVFTEPDLPGQIFLELTLVYPERQFIIRYSRYAKLDNENVVSCGPDSYMKLIVLDNPEQLMSLSSLANAAETKDLHFDTWHKSLEEATGMTTNEFYEIFKEANAPCITTPISVWQP